MALQKMNEGGLPDLSMYEPRIQELVRSGAIPHADAAWMNEYSKTKGDSRVETSKGMHKDLSEKYQNFYDRVRSGEIPDPYKANPATPKATPAPKGGGGGGGGMPKVNRDITKNYKKGGKISSASKRADGCAVKGKTKGRMV
jgi:hypothetical protein